MIKVGEYIRTPYGIGKIIHIPKHIWYADDGFVVEEGKTTRFIECGSKYMKKNLKSTPDIIKLLEPRDLLLIDIDNGYEGGIVVPRIPETQVELNNFINNFKDGTTTLVGIVSHEILQEHVYWIDDKNKKSEVK